MGIFGNDDEQNARFDALETHVRNLSDGVQQNMLDLVTLSVTMIAMRAQMEQKLSSADFDPAIIAMNEQLGVARIEFEKASKAAAESWSTMHAGAQDALSILRASTVEATEKIESELKD